MGAKVVGITGVSGCGKTTVSRLLRDRHEFHRVHFPYVIPGWLAECLLLNTKVPTLIELTAFMIDRALGMLVGSRHLGAENVVLDRWWFDACLNVGLEEREVLRDWYRRYASASLFNPDNFVGLYLVGSPDEFAKRKGKYSPEELRRQARMFELGSQILHEEGLPVPVRIDASKDPESIADDVSSLAPS